jgi:DNA-binding transcriptional LysR family regulator
VRPRPATSPSRPCLAAFAANAILDNWTSLQQGIATLRETSGALSGHLSVGVIPFALPMATLLTKAIHARHPRIDLTILSQSSIDILRHLGEFLLGVRNLHERYPRVCRGSCLPWHRSVCWDVVARPSLAGGAAGLAARAGNETQLRALDRRKY